MTLLPVNVALKSLYCRNAKPKCKSIENEALLLKSVPEAGILATKINQNILKSTLLWQEVTTLSVKEGLKKLKESHNESLKYLSYKNLAFIFKTSVSTISRILKDVE